MDRFRDFQDAIFAHVHDSVPLPRAAASVNIPITNLRRVYSSWLQSAPDSQPTAPKHISVDIRLLGRPCKLTKREEELVTAAVSYFSKMNTRLTKLVLRHLGAHVLKKSRHLELVGSSPTLSKTWM